MEKNIVNFRWVIIAPDPEVDKWANAFRQVNQDILLEVGPEVHSPETVDVLLLWRHPKGCLKSFSNVKIYFSLGAGVDHMLAEKDLLTGVPLCRIVDPLLSFSMSNYILFAVLYYQRRWVKFQEDQKNKIWDHDGKTEEEIRVGILGLGTLGSDAAKKLAFLGFKVLGYSPSPKNIEGVKTFSKESLDAFLKACNVLVCTVPYTPKTHGLLSRPLFEKMNHPTYLINVARGKVHVEKDILDALNKGQLSGAFLDVFEEEPLPKDSLFWDHPKVQLTPHIASITNPKAGVRQIIQTLEYLVNGKPLPHSVDIKKGY